MIIRYILLLVFIAFYQADLHANHCYIFIDPGSGMPGGNICNSFGKIKKSLDPKFVFPDSLKSNFKKFSKKYISGCPGNEVIIFSDSLVKMFHHKPGSYILILNDHEEEIYRLGLAEMNDKMDIINSFAYYRVTIRETEISKNILLDYSDPVRFTENYYYLYEFERGRILKVPREENKSGCREIIDPADFSFEKLYREIFKDTSGLYIQLSLLGKVNFRLAKYNRFEGFIVVHDTLHIIGQFLTYRQTGDGIFAENDYYLLQYINNKNIRFYKAEEKAGNGYFIRRIRDFKYLGNNSYLFPVSKDSLKPPYYFIAEYRIQNDTLRCYRILDNQLPSWYRQSKYTSTQLNGIFSDNYFFFESCPYFLDFRDNFNLKYLKVNGYIDSTNIFSFSSLGFYLHTFWETPHTFKVLYRFNDNIYIGCFLKDTGEQINEVYVPAFNMNIGLASIGCLFFTGEFTLSFASTGTNKMRFYILE